MTEPDPPAGDAGLVGHDEGHLLDGWARTLRRWTSEGLVASIVTPAEPSSRCEPATAVGGEAEARGSDPDQTLLGRAEAARYLGVHAMTIYRWARSGRLACTFTIGGHMRFSRADLDAARRGLGDDRA